MHEMKKKDIFLTVAVGFLLTALLSLSMVTLGWNTPEQGFYPDHPDRAIWMESGWRITCNQVPHRDFISPIGAGWLYLNALPVILFGPSYSHYSYGPVFLFLIFSLIYFSFFLRKGSVVAAIASIFYCYTLMAYSRFPDYNETGYLIIGFILVESLTIAGGRAFRSGWISGALLALLFFWKLNFFAVALTGVLMFIPFFPRKKIWFLDFFAGFFLLFLILLASIDWNLPGLLHDYAIPTPFRGMDTLRSISYLLAHLHILLKFFFFFLIAAVIFWISWRFSGSAVSLRFQAEIRWLFHKSSRLMDYTPGIVLLILFLSQNLLVLSNGSIWKPHSVWWVLLVSLVYLLPLTKQPKTLFSWLPASILFIILIPFVQVFVGRNILMEDKCRAIRSRIAVAADGSYSGRIREGLDLIHQAVAGKKVPGSPAVVSIDYSNPFPALLKSVPVKMDLLWWSAMDTFSPEKHPDIEPILAVTDVVMLPLWKEDANDAGRIAKKWAIFEKRVKESFDLYQQGKEWQIWIKRKAES